MKKIRLLINWIKRSPQRILRVAIGLGLIILGAALLRADFLNRQSTEWVLNNPAPLPEFLYSVSPAPGSRSQGSNEAICVTFNTRTPPLGPMTNEEEMSLFNHTYLYIDGSDISSTNPGERYGHPGALTGCLGGQFSGLHLAKVTTYKEISETLSYQWAFIGR